MSWNSIQMAQHYLSRANAIHPEEAENETIRDKNLAIQDLYYECYQESFDKSRLVALLEGVLMGNVKIPKEVNEENYKRAFMDEAGAILSSIAVR